MTFSFSRIALPHGGSQSKTPKWRYMSRFQRYRTRSGQLFAFKNERFLTRFWRSFKSSHTTVIPGKELHRC